MCKSTENGQKSNQNLPWKEICNQWISSIYIYCIIYTARIVQSPSWVGTWETLTRHLLIVMFCPFKKSSESLFKGKKNLWDRWKFVTCRASVGHYTWKHHGTQRVRCPRSWGPSPGWKVPVRMMKTSNLSCPRAIKSSNFIYGLKDRKGLCGWIVLSTSQMISKYRKLPYCWKWSWFFRATIGFSGRSCHCEFRNLNPSDPNAEASHVRRSHPFNGGWLVRFVMSMSGWAKQRWSSSFKFHLPQKPWPGLVMTCND